ncbi:acyltransferase [Nocardioides glacieisoli]|uniref:Acyltransferase n=1 Tax=Nocardioides glacieisoli TaxID=1168730 RepID=A0A4Q2RTH4_9ACTN|nr:acyltransferase family protein [Nocardioides glacieisoli]RYB92380.1 acyltransferase [Nocardioides glacieisoli]
MSHLDAPADALTSATPAPSTHKRDQSIDVARGITITVIVLGHVALGVGAAHLADSQQVEDVTRSLYLFRLSTLAYLSGLFVQRGVMKAGAKGFVTQRLLLFGWLYLLWSVVQGTAKALAGSLTNETMHWSEVLRLWVPEGQLWFLPWLMSVTVIAVAVKPWASRTRAVLSLGGALLLALAAWGLDPELIFMRGWALLLPFLAGCAMTASGHARVFRSLAVAWGVALMGAAIWLGLDFGFTVVPPTLGGEDRTVAGVVLGTVACVAATAACLAWASLLARTRASAAFGAVGRRSLEIFLAHIVVASGTRIALLQIGVDTLAVHLVVGVALGVFVPMALAVAADRLGWQWVFGLPGPLRRRWVSVS